VVDNFPKKKKFVNWKLFGLEKPDFHNLKIYSAGSILVWTLPGRQDLYLPRRRKDAKSDFRFSPVWIFICTTVRVLPFRQRLQGRLRPQVGDLRLWRLLPFRQKWAGELKTSTVMDISVFEGIFGLKSRIFITAEFILRHESSSETCLKGSTFPLISRGQWGLMGKGKGRTEF
jgi:hypothetical protein